MVKNAAAPPGRHESSPEYTTVVAWLFHVIATAVFSSTFCVVLRLGLTYVHFSSARPVGHERKLLLYSFPFFSYWTDSTRFGKRNASRGQMLPQDDSHRSACYRPP
ncbi:unnamed protein product [Ectocarpus sp. 12 AP-2014]